MRRRSIAIVQRCLNRGKSGGKLRVRGVFRSPVAAVEDHLSAGQCGDRNAGGSGIEQGLCACAGGGSRCHDVVDEQDGAAFDLLRTLNMKGAIEVDASLARSERCLRSGLALAYQRSRRKRKLPIGMGSAQGAERGSGKQTRLVEAACALAPRMQRYGNDEHLLRGVGSQRGDGLRELPAKRSAHGTNVGIFERVDGQA